MNTFVDISFEQINVKDFGNFYERLSQVDGYLYLISNGDKVKIGSSCSPVMRIKAIIAAGGITDSTAYISNRIKFYKKIEKHIHRELNEKRVIGEWFNVKVCDVINKFKSIKVNRNKFHINYMETIAIENLTIEMGIAK